MKENESRLGKYYDENTQKKHDAKNTVEKRKVKQ